MNRANPDLRILRDSALNLAGYGVPFALALAAVPVTIRTAGLDAFSVLSVMWGASSLLGMSLTGFSRYAARELSRETSPDARTAAASAALVPGLAFSLPLAASFFAAAPLLAGAMFGKTAVEAASVLRIAAVAVPLAASSSVLSAALEARRNFRALNSARMLFESFYIASAPAVFLLGGGLKEAALAVTAGKACETCVWFFLARGAGGLSGRWVFSLARAGEALAFAWPASLQRLAFQAGDEAGKIIVGAASGLQGLSIYALPHEIYRKLVIVPASASSALFPVFSRGSRRAEMRRYAGRLALVTFPIYAALALLAPQILAFLTGSEAPAGAVLILRLLLLARFLTGTNYLVSAWLQASGKVMLPASVSLTALAFFTALAWLGASELGAWAAAAAWVLKACCESLALLAASGPGAEVPGAKEPLTAV